MVIERDQESIKTNQMNNKFDLEKALQGKHFGDGTGRKVVDWKYWEKRKTISVEWDNGALVSYHIDGIYERGESKYNLRMLPEYKSVWVVGYLDGYNQPQVISGNSENDVMDGIRKLDRNCNFLHYCSDPVEVKIEIK